MRSPEVDEEFLKGCREKVEEVLWPEGKPGQGTVFPPAVKAVTSEQLAPLLEWVTSQGDPLEHEPKAPIPPGTMGFFADQDGDDTTWRLLNGAKFIDGGGRDLRPMKARAEGNCMFVSIASLAFGGRCASSEETERLALPLRAAMVSNAIVNIEEFLERNELFKMILFYDVCVSEGVFEGWNAEFTLQPQQARVALLWTIWFMAKVGVPCPFSCLPLIADVVKMGIRVFHPGKSARITADLRGEGVVHSLSRRESEKSCLTRRRFPCHQQHKGCQNRLKPAPFEFLPVRFRGSDRKELEFRGRGVHSSDNVLVAYFGMPVMRDDLIESRKLFATPTLTMPSSSSAKSLVLVCTPPTMRLTGMTLGCAAVPRAVYEPLHGVATANEPPLLVSFTMRSPEWERNNPFTSLYGYKEWERNNPFTSLYGYKERCFHPKQGRYAFREFNHVVPVPPPPEIFQQMDKECYILSIENEADLPPDAHVVSTEVRKLMLRQADRKAAAVKLETESRVNTMNTDARPVDPYVNDSDEDDWDEDDSSRECCDFLGWLSSLFTFCRPG